MDFLVSCCVRRDVCDKESILYYRYPRSTEEFASQITSSSDTGFAPGTLIKRDNLPPIMNGYKRVIIISDTHDSHHHIGDLPDADIFIHCGDILVTSTYFSNKHSLLAINNFNSWLGSSSVKAKEKIIIAGNHDTYLERIGKVEASRLFTNGKYIENDTITIENLKIWATPLSSKNKRSRNLAFQSEDFKLKTVSSLPKEDIDILLCHGTCNDIEELGVLNHKIKIWGHHHSAFGIHFPGSVVKGIKSKVFNVCAPILNQRYELKNYPILLDIPCNDESNRLVRLDYSHDVTSTFNYTTPHTKTNKVAISG